MNVDKLIQTANEINNVRFVSVDKKDN